MVIDIIHTAAWLEIRISKILKQFDITHPQFNIMRNVQAASPLPLSVQEIKETIMFKNSDVTRLIDRLVNKDLLIRETCPKNRRKVDVRISPKGIAMLAEITPKVKAFFSDIIEDQISVEEALRTSDILRLVRKQS